MPYEVKKLPDPVLKKVYLTLSDLERKAQLLNSGRHLGISSAVEGVSRDEQLAILERLSADHLLNMAGDNSFVNLKQDAFWPLYDSVFDEYHKRLHQSEAKAAKTEKPEILAKPTFDAKESFLSLKGYRIRIACRDELSVAHGILNHIFNRSGQPLTDDFFFSEIAADEFGDRDYTHRPLSWKRYYTACKSINEKIRLNTAEKIDDFLKPNTGKKARVRINTKFL